MTDNRKNNGGHKAGRKPTQDPKQAVTVYIKQSNIEQHGGIKELRLKILKAFEL
jgi:hypothetical protein